MLIYFYLCALIFIFETFSFICQKLFLSGKTYFHLSEVLFICQNLFWSVHAYFYLWESLLLYDHLWESSWSSVRICVESLYESLYLLKVFICESLYENKQVNEYHDLKQFFYHQNTLMIFYWFRMFQFFLFTLNSSHFVSHYIFDKQSVFIFF